MSQSNIQSKVEQLCDFLFSKSMPPGPPLWCCNGTGKDHVFHDRAEQESMGYSDAPLPEV
jgi:hypothetical protein